MNYYVLWDWVLAISIMLSPLMNNCATGRTLTNGGFL